MPCLLEKYRELLPLTPHTPIITLGEGNTPLVRSQSLEGKFGLGEVYFKLEGCNPTGSFKDRGMVVAAAKALEQGSKAIICASTGNTSASAAAYGSRSGLGTFVLVPKGNVALGKLSQAIVFGAKIIAIQGNFDQALRLVRELIQRLPLTLVNSINPYRLEGQKTAAFEIVDVLGEAPDCLFIPVGNAGNITAYWKGFKHYYEVGRAKKLPRMMGFEAEGAAPIVRGEAIEKPETIATAIRIGNPASWEKAVVARDESSGDIECVSDEEILQAYRLLAEEEGIFGEPASASSLAGLLKLKREGFELEGKRSVCIITGTGLKDPDTALKRAPSLIEVPAKLTAVEEVIGS